MGENMKNKIFKLILVVIVILILWSIGNLYINSIFLPTPVQTLNSFIELITNGMLWKAAITSFTRISIATFCAALISIPIGLLVVNYKWFDFIITGFTGFMRYFPVSAFLPLLIMWIGIGEPMKIVFLFCATFFYFLPSVILCLREVNHDLIDTALTMGMSKFQVMYKVLLPAALPNICESFLMMYGIGWTYVIIAETVNARVGLGFMMNIASARGRPDLVFVALITVLIISLLFDTVGKTLVKKIFKWKYAREMQD